MLAPPGGGKGLHSGRLSQATGVAHVSSGEHLRAEIGRGTSLGRRVASCMARGDLVLDDLMFEILTPVVVAAARDTGGFILDGFPRTVPQALRTAALGVELGLVGDAAVYLTAPSQVLIDRMLARGRREGRADDTPEVIGHRIEVFAQVTEPLVDYYASRQILVTVDADRPPEEVQADIRAQLAARGVPATRAASGPRRFRPASG